MDQPQLLMSGIAFGESPRWHSDRLWFADWAAEELIAVDLRGDSEVVAHVASFPFCIDWLPSGELLVVSAAQRQLLKRELDGTFSTYADLKPISDKGWNEIVVDGRANAYVNGGGFDLMAGEPFAPGLVVLVTPDHVVRQVADEIAFPNGMAVTPDNSTLIVAESYAGRLTAFEIADDGTLSNRRVWAELGKAAPDGDLHRRIRRGVVRGRAVPALCAGRGGWRAARRDRARSRLLLVHARRRDRTDAIHGRPRMARLGRGRGRAADWAAADGRGARTWRRLAGALPRLECMSPGHVARSIDNAASRVPGLRRLPVLKLIAIAQVGLLARDHLLRLSPGERRRVLALVRKAHGRPSTLTASERDELALLVIKLEPRLLAGQAFNHLSPVPVPQWVVRGRRKRR